MKCVGELLGIFWESMRKLRKQVRKGGGGREQVKKRNLNFSHIGGLNLVGKFKPRQIMSGARPVENVTCDCDLKKVTHLRDGLPKTR
jgi:hypothetical protein